jgi:N-acyl-D-aspartate/D-glutamate deacylase
MTLTANDGRTVFSADPPSTPRLRLRPGAATELLDGGWWPRSTDPVAELPGLVLAIDALHGPITRLMLHDSDWDSHPRRLAIAGRLVRVGYFASQPVGLLTGLTGSAGTRIDLVVIPPDTAPDTAETAMTLAAIKGNRIRAQDLVSTMAGPRPVRRPPAAAV